MNTMTIAAVISLVLLVGGIIAAIIGARNDWHDAGAALGLTGAGLAVVALIATCITGWLAIAPEYRLYRAEVEKRILVEEAKANADSAVEDARGEIERAKGTAEANQIVADSITEPYLRYLYILNLSKTDNQVIYLPTEAGLPILEADRLAQR